MKRLSGLIGIVLLCSGLLPAARSKLILTVHGDYFTLATNKFTSQSGKKKIFAEGKAALTISRNMYIWGSFGAFPLHDGWTAWSSKAVFDADLQVNRRLSKQVFSGGVGYFVGYFEPSEIAVRGEIGVCRIANDIGSTYNDITSGETIRTVSARQSAIGLRANLGITYGLYKKLFGELTVGFMYAADTINDVKSNLGGFNLSLGLGIRL